MSDSSTLDTSNSRPPGWWQYIVAANATGGGSAVMLLIGLAVGFVWGYYTKYKSYSNSGAEIVIQANDNARLDEIVNEKMKKNNHELRHTLEQLGYTTSQIKALFNGQQNTLDKFKDKVDRVFNNSEIYQSRQNCVDDYIGVEKSKQINQLILKRFNQEVKDE